MNTFRIATAISAALIAASAHGANPAAGKARVEAVCASCHGIRGISASPAFPNLAGQKEDYLRAALTGYRDGTRKNPIMGNMAASLSDADIADLAAYLSTLKPCD